MKLLRLWLRLVFRAVSCKVTRNGTRDDVGTSLSRQLKKYKSPRYTFPWRFPSLLSSLSSAFWLQTCSSFHKTFNWDTYREEKIVMVRPRQATWGKKTNKRALGPSVTRLGKHPPCPSIISAKPSRAYTIICTMSKATATQPQLPFSASLTWTSKPTAETHKV